jgi:hypothetical protein
VGTGVRVGGAVSLGGMDGVCVRVGKTARVGTTSGVGAVVHAPTSRSSGSRNERTFRRYNRDCSRNHSA